MRKKNDRLQNLYPTSKAFKVAIFASEMFAYEFLDCCLTKYSLLNSCSENASRLSSHESSKAVRMGSWSQYLVPQCDK